MKKEQIKKIIRFDVFDDGGEHRIGGFVAFLLPSSSSVLRLVLFAPVGGARR